MTLIERIEAAPEGSRELSDECLLAVGWILRDNGRDLAMWDAPNGSEWCAAEILPDPSQNLHDAIDWLVPEGWRWLCHDGSGMDDTMAGGFVSLHIAEDYIYGKAATPALAIVAAALRARETMEQADD